MTFPLDFCGVSPKYSGLPTGIPPNLTAGIHWNLHQISVVFHQNTVGCQLEYHLISQLASSGIPGDSCFSDFVSVHLKVIWRHTASFKF